MKKNKFAASSVSTPPLGQLAQELLHANEIEALYEEVDAEPIMVLGKFEVRAMLYYRVARQIDSIVHVLVSEEEYTPAEIIGDEDWFRFGQIGQRAMTLCLKHFAAYPDSDLVETDTGTFMLSF